VTQQPEKGGLERHFQSLALALITAAVLYMASFVVGAREEAAANKERLAGIAAQMAAVQAQLAAIQGNFVTRDEWRDHETRVRDLESQGRKRQQ
jgi:type IV secretory pathway VirB6-like protein